MYTFNKTTSIQFNCGALEPPLVTVLVRREALLGGEQLPAGEAGELLPAVDLGMLQEAALLVGLKVTVQWSHLSLGDSEQTLLHEEKFFDIF